MMDSFDSSRRSFLIGWIKRIGQNIKEISYLPESVKKVDKLIKNGEYNKAKELVEVLLREYPDLLELKKRLGLILYKLNQKDKALEVFQSIIKKDKDNMSFLYLAILEGEKGEKEKALEYIRRFFDPQNIVLQREINLNLALYESGEISFQQMLENLKKAITSD